MGLVLLASTTSNRCQLVLEPEIVLPPFLISTRLPIRIDLVQRYCNGGMRNYKQHLL